MPRYASPDYDPLMDELPPELAAQYKAEQRKQRLAAAMDAQSMQPLQAPEVKGRFQGAISPIAGLAQLAQAYMSSRMAEGADKNIADIGSRAATGKSEAIGRMTQAMVGTPDEVMPPGQAGPPRPGVPGSTDAAIRAGLESPYTQKMAQAILTQKLAQDAKHDQAIIPAGATLWKNGRAEYVAPEKTQYESMSNEEKLVRSTLLSKGLQEGTPEWNAAAAPLFNKLMDKRTHITIAGGGSGVSGGEKPGPEEVDFYAKAAMSGDQSWRVGLGRSKDGAALIRAVDRRLPELAKEANLSPEDVIANKQEMGARPGVVKAFNAGQQGQRVTSFNTAIDHLDTLRELGVALKNKDLQAANKIKNTAAAWTGDADITNLDTAKQIVGAEVIKSIVAGGGGQAERDEAANKISRISSPAQLEGYISTTQKLMGGQLKSLEQQYATGSKRKDFREKLTPRAKSVLESLDTADSAAPAGKVVDFGSLK
jgi:hypothetical protein